MSSIDPSGTIGYLGPRGTFTEQALCSQADLAALDLQPHGSIVEVLRAAERGDVTYGFAAIENMIEGSVNATLDTLAFDAEELLIQREVVMNISMHAPRRVQPTGNAAAVPFHKPHQHKQQHQKRHNGDDLVH